MTIKKLLKLLNEKQAEYVIIGATAFPIHGYSRATLDIDLFIKATEENAKRVREALDAFGYDVTDLSVADLIENKVLIREYLVATDIHPSVKGMTFDEVVLDALKETLEGEPVLVCSLDSLIKMKKAAARPKDLEDLKYLEKLKEKQVV